jgi:hypothetical protein
MPNKDKPWLDMPIIRAAPTPAPAEAAPEPDPTMTVDEYGRPIGGAPLPPAPEPLRRIGQAVVEGAKAPPFLTPKAKAAAEEENQKTWVGRNIVSPLVSVSELPFRGLNALAGGLGQAAYETGAAVGGPEMGRDMFMLNQVAPIIPASPMYATPPRNLLFTERPRAGVQDRPPGPAQTSEVYPPQPPAPVLDPRGVPIRDFTPEPFTMENVERPLMQVEPTAPAERGGSVGAAQSVNPPEMTPAEFRASRYDGELKRVMEGPKPGDSTEYVLGVKPTRAEIELVPSVSREAKGLRQEFREGFNEKEKEDNRVYYDTFDELAGTKTQVQSLERARSAQADKDLEAAGLTTDSKRTPVNAQKVVDKIDEILADPRVGESEDVVRYLKPIRDQMFDADGKLKDDPLRLYGIREGIVKKLSKASKAETPTVGNVEGQLLEVRDVLDGIIEQGAPGYAKYRKNYSDASQVIDYKERLQDAKTELTNGPDRVFTFGKFDRLLKNLIEERGEGGLPQAAHHIPEDVMDKLYSIHKSLQRSASDQELAKTRGSDTTQMLGELGRQGLAQGIAAVVPIPGASAVAPFIARHIGGMFTQRRLERHLNPDPSQYRPQGELPPGPLSPP